MLLATIKHCHVSFVCLFVCSDATIYRHWPFACPLIIQLSMPFNQLKMTEVSVETCFVNSKVLSYSLKSLLACCYQDLLEIINSL